MCNNDDASELHTDTMHGMIKLHKTLEKLNHLKYMDDIKLFAKHEKELETLLQVMRIYIHDIGVECGAENCAILKLKQKLR